MPVNCEIKTNNKISFCWLEVVFVCSQSQICLSSDIGLRAGLKLYDLQLVAADAQQEGCNQPSASTPQHSADDDIKLTKYVQYVCPVHSVEWQQHPCTRPTL